MTHGKTLWKPGLTYRAQVKQKLSEYKADLLIELARIADNYCNPDATIMCSRRRWLYRTASILRLSEGNVTLVIHHPRINRCTTYKTHKARINYFSTTLIEIKTILKCPCRCMSYLYQHTIHTYLNQCNKVFC